jgi:hypothetical protein
LTRWRVLVPALLTVAVLGSLALRQDATPGSAEATGEEAAGADKLRIRWLEPIELQPGEGLFVDVAGLDADAAVRARLSTADSVKYDAAVLHRTGERVVLRVPREVPPGPVKLRLYQGEGPAERKTKPRHLEIRRLPAGDTLRDALGGLALVLLGLYGAGRALRGYADQRVRKRLGRLTESRAGSLGLGAALGSLMQSTTAGAGVVAGLRDARMLGERGALTVLFGVQLGAAIVGILLPLASRESLWVVALGGVWVAAADDRRMRAFGNVILGCGLLLLGLRLLQDGLRPLVSDPALVPYLEPIRADRPFGMVVAVVVGALLCALLQGPGPVFALVTSLAQSSALLGLGEALAVLAGTTLGAALVVPLFGRIGARVTAAYVLASLAMTAVMLAGAPLWVMAADALAVGDALATDGVGRVLRPAIAGHLGAGYAVAQGVALVVGLLLRDACLRLTWRWFPAGEGSMRPRAPGASLGGALAACRAAIVALREVVETRGREPAVIAEKAIAEARAMLQELLRDDAAQQGSETAARRAALVCLHVVSATGGALRVVEIALEQDLAPDAAEVLRLRRFHDLLVESVDAVIAHVDGARPLALDEVRAREIRLNALLEAEGREPGVGESVRGGVRLWLGELAVACEAIGNQLYRMATTLGEDPEAA